jgi:hypothetical protein
MRTTVDQKILKELQSKQRVSCVRLGHRSNSFAVHSAIARLRLKGWRIGCELTKVPNRKSWYTLLAKRPVTKNRRKSHVHKKTKR